MNDSPIQFGVRPANDAPASCATCRFSHRSHGDLLCRRNPPQLSVVLGPAPPPRVDQMMPLPFCGFPPVNDRMWCGEYVAVMRVGVA